MRVGLHEEITLNTEYCWPRIFQQTISAGGGIHQRIGKMRFLKAEIIRLGWQLDSKVETTLTNDTLYRSLLPYE